MRAKEFLIEANNYVDMFDRMLKIGFPDPAKFQKAKNKYQITADNARKILKRKDRIVWYIQQVKIDTMLSSKDYASVSDEKKAAFDAELNKLYKKYPPSQSRLPSGFIFTLEHYLSLPVPAIQNYQFTNQTIEQVVRDFENAETEWRKSTNGHISAQPNDKILIDMGKSAWWLLDRGACDQEGDAMGHCGNVPSERPGDRILSFRTKVTDQVWRSNLTFILDKNGVLGEMKGRGNEKPNPKYHDAIVQLLTHDIVRGIKGGGYMPEHNFDMTDLPEHTRKQLYKTKPELMPLVDKFKHFGTNHELSRTELMDQLDNIGYLPITVNDLQAIKIDEYDVGDIGKIMEEHNLLNMSKLLNSLSTLRFSSGYVDKPDDTYLLNHVFKHIKPTPDVVKYLKQYTNTSITHGSDILNTVQKYKTADRAKANETDRMAIVTMRKFYNHIEECIDDDLKTNTTDAAIDLLHTISKNNPVKFDITESDDTWPIIQEYVELDHIIDKMMQGNAKLSDVTDAIGYEPFDMESYDISEDADLTDYLEPESVYDCMKHYIKQLNKPIELNWPDDDNVW